MGKTFFESLNNTSDKTNGVNSAVSCYKEAVQFSASFVMSLFASFLTKFVERQWILHFFVRVTLIKIANTPLDRSAVLGPQLTERGSAALATAKSRWKFAEC